MSGFWTVRYYASSAAVNPDCLALQPRVARRSSGCSYTSLPCQVRLGKESCPPACLFSSRGAARGFSTCESRHEQPVPFEMAFAYRAVGAKSRGCVRFRLSHVVPWSAGCGNLPS